jgi:hypothetical protein
MDAKKEDEFCIELVRLAIICWIIIWEVIGLNSGGDVVTAVFFLSSRSL